MKNKRVKIRVLVKDVMMDILSLIIFGLLMFEMFFDYFTNSRED